MKQSTDHSSVNSGDCFGRSSVSKLPTDDGQSFRTNTEQSVSPMEWYARMPTPSVLAMADEAGLTVLRHFVGIQSDIVKPPLSDNVLVIHLAGPKRIRRWQDGRTQIFDVERNSCTVMPSFRHNRWVTEGPANFAHLSLSSEMLSRFARDVFDRDPNDLRLRDRVGQTHPLVSELFLELLRDGKSWEGTRLYRESLITSLVMVLLREFVDLARPMQNRTPSRAGSPLRGGLAGWQKRRVLEYMAEHLAADIGTAELMKLTGLSRAQFFRAFSQSVGYTPQRYLTALRMERAKQLLGKGDMSMEDTAAATGFRCPRRFAESFKREVGVAARLYRCSQYSALRACSDLSESADGPNML